MAYSRQTWLDLPSQTTPVNAARLNHMEAGIEGAAGAADNLYSQVQALAARVSALESGTPPTPSGPFTRPQSSLWMWSTNAKVAQNRYPVATVTAIAQALGLQRVWVWAQPNLGSGTAKQSFLENLTVKNWLTALKDSLGEVDIAMDALFGDAWYCIPASAYPNNPFKTALTRWAQDCASSGLFERLHLDNEPAGVNADPELVDLGWAWPQRKEELMAGTLEGYQMVKDASDMPLDVDCQYQIWDSSNPNYANFERADGTRFGAQVLSMCDGVGVMSYQNTTAGIIAKAAPAITAGQAAGVPVWAGLNVDDEGSDPGSSLLVPGYTFGQMVSDVDTVLTGSPNAIGVGCHSMDQIMTLYAAQ